MAARNTHKPLARETAADRYLRERRKLDRLTRTWEALPSSRMASLAGVGLAAETFSSLFGGETFRMKLEAAQRHELLMRDLRDGITPASILAAQGVAEAMRHALPNLSSHMIEMSASLQPAFASAAAALTAHSQAVAGILGSNPLRDRIATFESLSRTLGEQLASVGRSIEAARVLEALASAASRDDATARDRWLEQVAEQAVRAEKALGAAAESRTVQARVHNLRAFVEAVAALFARIRRNTIIEAKDLGLIGLFMLAVTITDVLEPDPTVKMSDEDRRSLQAVRQEVVALREQLLQFQEIEARAESEFLAGLLRAEVKTAANIRSEPSGASPRLSRLAPGTIVAIEARRGRWCRILFRDELSGALSQGWVYSASLLPL